MTQDQASAVLPSIRSSPSPDHAEREKVLVVDDTPANLNLLCAALEPAGINVLVAADGNTALELAARLLPDLILLDVMMPGLDGFETCRRLKASQATRHIPVLFISARNETASLLQGFEAGGVDYITKPFQADEVRTRAETHLRLSRLTRELVRKNAELAEANERLRRETARRENAEEALHSADEKLSRLSEREAQRWGLKAFVGASPAAGNVLRDVRRLQSFPTVSALICGESGTGKELVARAIHFGGPRAKGPFIAVNCVAVPEDLAESTFFGHVRGAFTGATIDRKGCFELAHGGTLFLDEIGDMPASLQAKLLRVLEDGRVTPVGAAQAKQVDVRIVAATNADLHHKIRTGAFRQDLYFRLAQFTVTTPPLRDRPEDIAPLARHFLTVFATEMGMAVPRLHPSAVRVLEAHPFPGNVRELKNTIERALIESAGAAIEPHHLHVLGATLASAPHVPAPADPLPAVEAGADEELPLNLEAAESALIRRALAATGGNVAEAARRLGVNRTWIYRKMHETPPA